MDVTPFLDLKIAPKVIFDSLPERRTRPRFMVPTPDGDYRAVTWGAFGAGGSSRFAGPAPPSRRAAFGRGAARWRGARECQIPRTGQGLHCGGEQPE